MEPTVSGPSLGLIRVLVDGLLTRVSFIERVGCRGSRVSLSSNSITAVVASVAFNSTEEPGATDGPKKGVAQGTVFHPFVAPSKPRRLISARTKEGFRVQVRGLYRRLFTVISDLAERR